MRIAETRLRRVIRSILVNEGGLKLPPDQRRDLTPQVVREAGKIYRDFVSGFNSWLAERGVTPIDPIGPTGSSTHAERDSVDRPGTTYGDIDYLVSFPVDYSDADFSTRRKEEAVAARKYTELMTQYLTSARPSGVEVELTLAGNPLMIIVKVPSGGMAQVDTVITHPPYTDWMRGRYTPERGVKGYVTGNLYKALGDHLTLTIGTEGVIARLQGGERVTSRQRSGVTYQSISTDFRHFLVDIADYLIGGSYAPHPLLARYPGGDPDEVTVSDLAKGIVGLARTLEASGMARSQQMLQSVLDGFTAGMEDNVGRKVSKDITPEQEAKLRKLNVTQGERVRQIFMGETDS